MKFPNALTHPVSYGSVVSTVDALVASAIVESETVESVLLIEEDSVDKVVSSSPCSSSPASNSLPLDSSRFLRVLEELVVLRAHVKVPTAPTGGEQHEMGISYPVALTVVQSEGPVAPQHSN